jgi:ribose-phosphate pyrophosphokinase
MLKTINLANPENSEIKFTVSKFPDGQQSIAIDDAPAFIQGSDVKLYSRLNNFRDLELIICANQALRNMAVSTVSLYVPYFMGARSDRKFSDGSVNYLKQVICPIVNAQKFNAVLVLDPHSDVLEACLNNYEKLDNHTLVKHALTDIDNKNGAQERIVLVSPDAGAYKKIFDVAQKFKITNVVTAMKHRDIISGKITHTEIPNITQYGENHKFVIVDDICDGGRTFIELAKEIRKHNTISEIYLIVTHGIFSAGFGELNNHFTKIYTTNSYSVLDNSQLLQFNVF